jgi:RsiW-degrading membrane proteinase PrsW (M82 family)
MDLSVASVLVVLSIVYVTIWIFYYQKNFPSMSSMQAICMGLLSLPTLLVGAISFVLSVFGVKVYLICELDVTQDDSKGVGGNTPDGDE